MENSKETIIDADTYGQMWSPYDLNPDRITEELSKVFTYNDTETERHNHTDLYYSINKADMNDYAKSHLAKGGGSITQEAYVDVPFVGVAGAKFGMSGYGESADSSSGSLLKQLNDSSQKIFTSKDIQRMFTQQGTELEFKGEKIKPKSFHVYKLIDVTDQIQVGIISKQLIAEKKDGAIIRTISALNFPPFGSENVSTTFPLGETTPTELPAVQPRFNSILTGEIRIYAGEEEHLPSPWLLCNGSTVSRTEFPKLFAVIGESYGKGDGMNTFNLPDLRGRTIVGVDKSEHRIANGEICGREGGSFNRSLTLEELPTHDHGHGSLYVAKSGSHTHSIYDPGHNHGGSTGDAGIINTQGSTHIHYTGRASISEGSHRHSIPTGTTSISMHSAGDHTHSVHGNTTTVGKGATFNIMPPYQTINYIIFPL